jgi:hypothetical protein
LTGEELKAAVTVVYRPSVTVQVFPLLAVQPDQIVDAPGAGEAVRRTAFTESLSEQTPEEVPSAAMVQLIPLPPVTVPAAPAAAPRTVNGHTPVPLRPRFSAGVLPALDVMTSREDLTPAETGVKVTSIVQLWPAPIVGLRLGQVPGLRPNVVASPPERDTEFTVKATVPVLVTVKACVLDVPPFT